MAQSYTDQFFIVDPGNPPPGGTVLQAYRLGFTDADGDGYISATGDDAVEGHGVTAVWVDDRIRVRMDGQNTWIKGTTFYLDGGPAIFTPNDGTVLSEATFVRASYVTQSTRMPVGDFGPPCFTAGSLIDTPAGPRPVEEIAVGDLVLTRDNGAQPVRWHGHRAVAGQGAFAPVRFAAGVLGNPRPLLVSARHRALIGGWQAELYAGAEEVLVAAIHLVGRPGVTRAPLPRVTYHHLLFDRHEIVTSDGAATESLHPGDWLMRADRAMAAELRAICPDLALPCSGGGRVTARPVLAGAVARLVTPAPLPAPVRPALPLAA